VAVKLGLWQVAYHYARMKSHNTNMYTQISTTHKCHALYLSYNTHHNNRYTLAEGVKELIAGGKGFVFCTGTGEVLPPTATGMHGMGGKEKRRSMTVHSSTSYACVVSVNAQRKVWKVDRVVTTYETTKVLLKNTFSFTMQTFLI